MTDAVTDDHGTEELCLAEVERCAQRSDGTAFVMLSGERYGWRALPRRVPAAEMAVLLCHVPAGSLTCVTTWYREDANAEPPEYVLRGVREVAADHTAPAEFKSFWGDEEMDLKSSQDMLTKALRTAAQRAELSAPRVAAWTISVTHKEVAAAPGNSLVLQRTLTGLREAAMAPGADAAAAEAAAQYFAHKEDVALLDTLRAEARALGRGPAGPPLSSQGWLPRGSTHLTAGPLTPAFGGAFCTSGPMKPASVALASCIWPCFSACAPKGAMNFLSFRHPWRGRALGAGDADDLAYLRRISAQLYARLAAEAQTAAARRLKLEPVASEAAAHGLMARSRADAFVGRKGLLDAATALLTPTHEASLPRVVFGAMGAGKTSLLAAAAIGGATEACTTIVRLCGTSPESSSARALLHSICGQIELAYGRSLAADNATESGSLEAQAARLVALMRECPTAARPLRLAIDSLDQLSNADVGRSRVWGWLPAEVPPHCSLLLSTLPDDGIHLTILSQLRAKLAAHASFLPVTSLSVDDSADMMAALLAAWRPAPRHVNDVQMSALVKAVAGAGDVTALHVKLLAGEAARLRAWDAPPGPAAKLSTVPGLIKRLYSRLEVRRTGARTPLWPSRRRSRDRGEAAASGAFRAGPSAHIVRQSAFQCMELRVPGGTIHLVTLALTIRALPPPLPLVTWLQSEHGPKLVPLVLGLLAVRRGGLSAGALLDAVSASDDVLGAMGQEGTVLQHTGAGRAVQRGGGGAATGNTRGRHPCLDKSRRGLSLSVHAWNGVTPPLSTYSGVASLSYNIDTQEVVVGGAYRATAYRPSPLPPPLTSSPQMRRPCGAARHWSSRACGSHLPTLWSSARGRAGLPSSATTTASFGRWPSGGI